MCIVVVVCYLALSQAEVEVSLSPQLLAATSGREWQFDCSVVVGTVGKIKVDWYKWSRFGHTQLDSVTVEQSGDVVKSLVFDDVQPNDAGSYFCDARVTHNDSSVEVGSSNRAVMSYDGEWFLLFCIRLPEYRAYQ